MEELPARPRAVVITGVGEVEAPGSGAEPTLIFEGDLLHPRHDTTITGYMATTKQYHNPDSLLQSPVFSQAVSVEGASRTIYIGGQNGVGPDGVVVGDSLAEQTKQILRNILVILEDAGATPDDVIQWRLAIVEGHSIQEGFGVFQEVWPAVADVAHHHRHHRQRAHGPGAVVEIDAIAVV